MGDPIVWSYGGGVQTAAIAVLVRRGELPKPDLTVMADTGREATETWDYLRDVIAGYLAPAGVTVEVAPAAELATVDLYGGSDGDSLLVPAFTAGGKLPTYCSTEWKARVVERWLRGRGVRRCRQWLGYSTDEMRRVHANQRPWLANEFPLIEKRISRQGCLLLVERAGLPPPPKSSCYICPHRRDWQWKRLKDHYPEDFARACAVDEQIRTRDTQGGVYLSSQRVPLALADFSGAAEPTDDEPNLFRACESGYCWV